MAATREFGSSTADSTVIGPSILISGKLTGDEDLTVRGRVEGELSLTKTLIVETSGIVKANVAVRNAIVSGVVVGNITATESVELTKEGRMVGDIRSPRVIIVDGASFRGRVDMGNAEPRAASERPTIARPVSRPTLTTRPAAQPVRPAAALAKPVVPARPVVPSKPQPPAAPRVEARADTKPEAKAPAPPPPPQPVSVAEAGKKKVLIKKKT
ncbi:MAG: polymer-forming cytoskeletal protein [Archangium sp.]|nr:polymer-forming cytoskeletal protein [Archangium sp.]